MIHRLNPIARSRTAIARAFTTLSLAVLVPLAVPVTSTAATIFQKIADNNTVIPAGTWAGQKFGTYTSSGITSPPVITDGTVLFLGQPASQYDNGAYLWSNGSLSLLADPSVPVPGRPASQFSELRYPSAFNGDFAFSSYDGLYSTVSGSLVKAMDPSDGFIASSAPAVDGASTWFFGENPNDGVFRSTHTPTGNVITTIAAVGTPVPGSPGATFTSLNCNVGGASGGVVFDAFTSANQQGDYLYANGSLQKIADKSTPAPGVAGNFSFFSNLGFAYDGQTVLFLAADTVRGYGIYADKNGIITSIASNGESAPGGGTFSFGYGGGGGFSVDGDDIAINGGRAIYTDIDGAGFTRLIGIGDSFQGSTVTSVLISNQALSDGQVAFYASLANGQSGIYLATVPEPATATSFLLLSTCALTRRREKSRAEKHMPTKNR